MTKGYREYGATRAMLAKQRAEIVRLREEGLTFKEISQEIGKDVASVWRQYQRAVAEIPADIVRVHHENAARRLDEQLQRIDMAREIVLGILAAHHVIVSQGRVVFLDDAPLTDHGPALAAVDRLIKLDLEEADLLGLKAERKISISGGIRYEVVGIDPQDLT